MSGAVLGIDPGHDGGLGVLVPDSSRRSGVRAAVAAAWSCSRRRSERYDLRLLHNLDSQRGRFGGRAADLHQIGMASGEYLGALEGVVGVVEGLSVHRKAAPDTAIALGRAEGYVTGPLLAWVDRWLDPPRASSWRPAVLGHLGIVPNSSSDDSEAAARTLCEQLGLAGDLGELLEDGHAVEAVAIAWWGWLQLQAEARMAAQQDLIAGRSGGRGR